MDNFDNDAAPAAVSPSLEFALRLARAQATLVRRLDQVLGGYHGISFGDFMLLHYLNRAPGGRFRYCLLYTSPSPRDGLLSRMPSSA